MTGSKKASTNGSSRRSKSNSLPPAVPPTSDDAAIAPSSDSLALPSASASTSKKLFPLFDNKARGKKAAPSQLGTSDVESNANLSESSQTAEKKTKKATNSKGKSKSNGVSNGQKSDAPSSLKSKTTENSKAAKTRTSSKAESMLKKKTTKKSKSPPGERQVDDLDMTISTVASTSTSSTTPPPSPHKTVITITDSPVREMRPTKTFADLEAERQAKKAAKEAGGWHGGRLPLWPSRGNSHVQPADPVSGVLERVAWPKIDWKGKGRAVEADMLAGAEYNTKRSTNVNLHDVKSIVQNYAFLEKQVETTASGASQPSMGVLDEASRERLKMVSQDQSQDNCQQTWYQRYAPLKATDVLGDVNRENAIYLRDWLQELTLQGELALPFSSIFAIDDCQC